MRLHGDLGCAAQAPDLLRSLDHPGDVHVERHVDDLVPCQHLQSPAEPGGQVLALGADGETRDVALLQNGAGGLEEVLVEVHVDVGEELSHRIGAHVLDPGRIHRKVKVDGRHHEGRLPGRIAEIEHGERPIAEIAAVVEKPADVLGVLGTAENDGVDALAVHHRLQARFVKNGRCSLHGPLLAFGAFEGKLAGPILAARTMGVHLVISSRRNLPDPPANHRPPRTPEARMLPRPRASAAASRTRRSVVRRCRRACRRARRTPARN